MPHPRTVIRSAVVSRLMNATGAEDRVEATRITSYRPIDLPAISIYTLEETVDIEQGKETAPREWTRDLELEIEGWVAAGPAMDDAMDDLALEIETAMNADPYLGGAAAESTFRGSAMAIRGEGDRLMGLVTLSYMIRYRTGPLPEEPDGMDDFLVADTTHRPIGVHEDEIARDEITVQESA